MGKASGSGGRGGGESGVNSAIGKEPPISVTSEKNKSSGGVWKREVLSASVDSNGNLKLDYASGKLNQINNNTTIATYDLKAGIYQPVNSSSRFNSHNINWDNVRSVSGNTFGARDFLKGKGFSWDGASKTWKK